MKKINFSTNIQDNWFEIYGRRFHIDRRHPSDGRVIPNLDNPKEEVFVIRTYSEKEQERNNGKDTNIFYYDINGNLLWQAEKPHFPDGSGCPNTYFFGIAHLSKSGYLQLLITGDPKSGGVLPGHRVEWRDDDYVEYLANVKTGKLEYVKDPTRNFAKNEYYGFREKKNMVLDLEWAAGPLVSLQKRTEEEEKRKR